MFSLTSKSNMVSEKLEALKPEIMIIIHDIIRFYKYIGQTLIGLFLFVSLKITLPRNDNKSAYDLRG